MSTRIAMVLAVILGVVAAVAVKSWIEAQKAETLRKLDPVMILVARENLRKGEPLKEDQVEAKMVEKPLVTSDMIPKQEIVLHVNKVLTQDVEKGWPISRRVLQARLERQTTAQALVKEGKRAVSLQVDQVSGVAGLIQPGNFVDLIGTFEMRPESAAKGAPQATGGRETKTICLLESVKVLTVDNRTIEVTSRASAGGGYRVITVEVDPWNALRLINAANQGRIQCLLRSQGDVREQLGTKDAKRTSWDLLSEVKETVDYTKYPRTDEKEKEKKGD